MADGFLSPADLDAFKAQAIANDPFALAGQGLLKTQLDTSTWSPTAAGVGTFAKAFLGGLMNNYAQQQANQQVSQVLGAMPQLRADPLGMTAPEGVDAGAFDMLRGRAALANEARQSALDQTLASRGVFLDSPELSERFGQILGRQQAAQAKGQIQGQIQAWGQGDPSSIPDSPQFKLKQQGEERLIGLRKEFNSLEPVKNFSKAAQAASAISGALKDTGKVADQELVRYSIQMIEPGMAVREGEQNAVAASQSIPEEWKAKVTSALEGKSQLGPEIREGLKRLAERAYSSHKGLYDQAFGLYGKEAELQGLDPNRLSYIGKPKEFSEIFSSAKSPSASRMGAAMQDLSNASGIDAAKIEFARKAKASGMSIEDARNAWALEEKKLLGGISDLGADILKMR